MTPTRTLKFLAATIAAVAMTSGAAIAGNGKDCTEKNHTSVTKSEVNQQTAVLPASAEKMKQADKKYMKTYTFDEALALCTEHGAADLQACIDKKTGKMDKPKT